MAEDNDRITQAILNATIQNNTRALETMATTLEKLFVSISKLENRMTRAETRIDGHKESINNLRAKSDVWNIINSLGASAAAFLAWFK